MKKERLNFNERMKFSNIFWVLCILLFASGVPVTAIGLSMSKLSFVVSGAGIVIIGFVSFYISLKLEDEARHGDRDHQIPLIQLSFLRLFFLLELSLLLYLLEHGRVGMLNIA